MDVVMWPMTCNLISIGLFIHFIVSDWPQNREAVINRKVNFLKDTFVL